MDTEKIIHAMIDYDKGDPMRIHHFLKVYEFARLIGEGERAEPHTEEIIETAAIVHDIGIHLSEQKYGSSAGKYQEIEGPAEAKTLLEKLDVDADIIERVCYLVGHHHTYTHIDGLDYQALVEADFLVNLYEDFSDKAKRADAVKSAYTHIFKTETGRALCRDIYGVQK